MCIWLNGVTPTKENKAIKTKRDAPFCSPNSCPEGQEVMKEARRGSD